MSWLYGYFFKTGKIDRPPLRPHLHSFEAAKVEVYAGGSGKHLLHFPHPHKPGETVFILGDPILRKGADFRYPDSDDWHVLLADERHLDCLDGHWLILIAANSEIRAYNDLLCKRSLYLYELSDYFYFCSDITLLKDAGLAKIDPEKMGAYWHTQFPPHQRRYAPGSFSYYQDTQMLFQRGTLLLSDQGAKISYQVFSPDAEVQNLHKMLENMTLLPLRAGRKVCLGLSAGMDVRPLLAIIMNSGLPISTVHFGRDTTEDYRLARRIATDLGLSFRFIAERSVDTGWESVRKYMYSRGFGYNPASSCLMQYFPILAEDFDVFLGGYYGEIFRCRMMAAHFFSLFKLRTPDYRYFTGYLDLKPHSFFVPEVNLSMHKGFVHSLKDSLAQMPPPDGMPNPLWMNLFYVRYSPRSINMPDFCHLDSQINDHMPYLQASLLNQHWKYGAWAQLDEQVHRRVIREYFPQLSRYPLALAQHSAPYNYRPYAMKILVALKTRREKHPAPGRNEVFLRANKEHIMALGNDSSVIGDTMLDMAKVRQIITEYYRGDTSYTNALISFISFVLGK